MATKPLFLTCTDFRRIFPVAPSTWREVSRRGYTRARRYVVDFDNGHSAFIKLAADAQTARWLEAEFRMYTFLSTELMPRFYGFGYTDENLPFLVLEDLSGAHWPPPWTEEQIRQVREALEEIHSLPAPSFLHNLEDLREHDLGGWTEVQNHPERFTALGLAEESWLKHALPTLLEAEKNAPLAGEQLVHWDIRSDNLCFTHDRVKVIDWNHACRGNGTFDLIGWLPSLALENGPRPWDVTLEPAGLIALMAGYFAQRAPLPPPHPRSRLRIAQREQLRIALPWACRALDLPLPKPLQDAQTSS